MTISFPYDNLRIWLLKPTLNRHLQYTKFLEPGGMMAQQQQMDSMATQRTEHQVSTT